MSYDKKVFPKRKNVQGIFPEQCRRDKNFLGKKRMDKNFFESKMTKKKKIVFDENKRVLLWAGKMPTATPWSDKFCVVPNDEWYSSL